MAQSLEELSTVVARLSDEREIERIILSYGHVIDFGTPADYAALFTDDGVVEVRSAFFQVLGLDIGIPKPLMELMVSRGAEPTADGMAFRGEAALKAFVTRPPRTARSLHVTSQPLVRLIDADTAEAKSYLRIYSHAPQAQPQLMGFGRYLDEFKRTASGWRIRQRVIEM